jgi:hypothetical protein
MSDSDTKPCKVEGRLMATQKISLLSHTVHVRTGVMTFMA